MPIYAHNADQAPYDLRVQLIYFGFAVYSQIKRPHRGHASRAIFKKRFDSQKTKLFFYI